MRYFSTVTLLGCVSSLLTASSARADNDDVVRSRTTLGIMVNRDIHLHDQAGTVTSTLARFHGEMAIDPISPGAKLYVGASGGFRFHGYPNVDIAVELDLGYDIGNDVPFLTARCYQKYGRVFGFISSEYAFVGTRTLYYFAQYGYSFTDWLSLSGEIEGWGTIEHNRDWSHGSGPGIVFSFSPVTVEVVTAVRLVDEPATKEFDPDVFMDVNTRFTLSF